MVGMGGLGGLRIYPTICSELGFGVLVFYVRNEFSSHWSDSILLLPFLALFLVAPKISHLCIPARQGLNVQETQVQLATIYYSIHESYE